MTFGGFIRPMGKPFFVRKNLVQKHPVLNNQVPKNRVSNSSLEARVS
jgi:hypothetical protein